MSLVKLRKKSAPSEYVYVLEGSKLFWQSAQTGLWEYDTGSPLPAVPGAVVPTLITNGSELAYAESVEPFSVGPSTIADIDGLQVAVTVDGSFPIRIIVDMPYCYHSVTAKQAKIELWDVEANVPIAMGGFSSATANMVGGIHFSKRITPTPGTHNYKLRLRNLDATAGGTANTFADPGPGNAGVPLINSLSVEAL